MPWVAAPRRAVILKVCCMGDVLMATPLAATLRQAWPAAELHWVVDEHSRPVLAGNPHVTALLDGTGVVRGSYRAAAIVRLSRA
jgi:ADP-heptose:LPS heptosyltransferase